MTHQVNIRSEKQGKFVCCYIMLCITVVKSAFLRFVVDRLLSKWWESLLALPADRLDSHSRMTSRTPSQCAHFAFGNLSAVSMNSLKIKQFSEQSVSQRSVQQAYVCLHFDRYTDSAQVRKSLRLFHSPEHGHSQNQKLQR